MAKEHKTVNKVRADEACTTSYEYAFAGRRGQELHGRETGQSGVRDGLRVGVVNRFGLVIGALGKLGMVVYSCRDRLEIVGFQDIVRTKIEGTEGFDGDLRVETEAGEANGGDLFAILVQSFNLRAPRG